MAVSGTKERHREHHPPDPGGRHRSHHRTKKRAAYLHQTREAEGRGPARGRRTNLAAQSPRLPGSTPTLLDAMTDTGLPHLARCGNRFGEPNCAHFDRAADRGRRAFRYDGRGRTDSCGGRNVCATDRPEPQVRNPTPQRRGMFTIPTSSGNGSVTAPLCRRPCTARRSCVPTRLPGRAPMAEVLPCRRGLGGSAAPCRSGCKP